MCRARLADKIIEPMNVFTVKNNAKYRASDPARDVHARSKMHFKIVKMLSLWVLSSAKCSRASTNRRPYYDFQYYVGTPRSLFLTRI